MEHELPLTSLTSQLYSSSHFAVTAATKHPFLEQAGRGVLPASTLCMWLVQDKYYQLAYVNFLGGLLAKLPLDSCAFPDSNQGSLPWETLDTLMTALENIREEIKFYDKIVEKYRLPIEKALPNRVTNQYIELFEEAGAKDTPLIHGLVVLWATEKCYVDAWSYALSQTSVTDRVLSSAGVKDGAIAALHREFIPNWTSEQFQGFVKNLASLTDSWAEKSDLNDIEMTKNFWSRVLELEAKFWPDVLTQA